MSFYDLNVLHPASPRLVACLDKLGYRTIAINYVHTGKINPSQPIVNPISKSAYPDSPSLTILSRITITLEDANLNYNLQSATKNFDILAIRPTTEKSLHHASTALDVDLISLDLTARLGYHLKHSTLGAATSREIGLEICYASATRDPGARRNLLSNAASLVRATRGRGLSISSGSSEAIEVRGPYDLINLATFWGLTQERGRDAVGEAPRKVIVRAATRRGVHKGVLRVVQAPEVKPYKRPIAETEGGVAGQGESKKMKKMKKWGKEEEEGKEETAAVGGVAGLGIAS